LRLPWAGFSTAKPFGLSVSADASVNALGAKLGVTSCSPIGQKKLLPALTGATAPPERVLPVGPNRTALASTVVASNQSVVRMATGTAGRCACLAVDLCRGCLEGSLIGTAVQFRPSRPCCLSRVCDPVFQPGCPLSGENVELMALRVFVPLAARVSFRIAAQLVVQD